MNTRAAYESLLVQTCDVYRPTTSRNAYHEVVPGADELIDEGVACFCAFPSGRKSILPVGIDPSKLRLIYFKSDQDVQERDVIVHNGRKYIVNSVDSAGLDGHHLEAMCETVVGG